MVRAIMIVEMAGKPAVHLKETLSNHVMILNDEIKDIEVHTIKISEPKEIETKNSETVYTCFAEVDFESESFSRLSEVMFDFMPSSVEVIAPGTITLNTQEASTLLNNISGRMHRYDEVAKVAQMRVGEVNSQLEQVKKAIEVGDLKIMKKSSKKTTKKISKKSDSLKKVSSTKEKSRKP